MSLDDLLFCSMPSSARGERQYTAPDAHKPEPLVVEHTPKDPPKRKQSARRTVLTREHSGPVHALMREMGPSTRKAIQARYAVLDDREFLSVLRVLDYARRIVRDSRVFCRGNATLWRAV